MGFLASPPRFCPYLLASLVFCFGCGADPEPAQTKPEPAPHFDYPLDDVLRLQHVVMKGTHNSYHLANPELDDPEAKVSQAPLEVQLEEQGVRAVELDLHRDLANGGFKVFHTPIFDEATTCPTLAACLAVMKKWSDAHRAHHPLAVQIDINDPAPAGAELEAYFDELHSTILSVWPKERILRPDEVQGSYATLGEAVKTEGWPVLGKLRGRILFTMYNLTDGFGQGYSRNGTSLAGRLAFTRALPTEANAAVTLYDDPTVTGDLITPAVAANMLVRTRADIIADGPATAELRDAALASGAHFIATDFPAPVAGMDVWLDIPGGTPSNCNPVTAPPECTPEAIEDPKFMNP